MGGFCNEVRCIMKKENNSAHNHNRGSFSGRIGYVLAVAGSAVGLGNIWRFPYLAAKYGGGIFLLIYILLTASFGYVLIMSETALGRMTRKSPVGAFEHFGKTKSFKIGGWLNAVIPMLIVPYYSTIGGWVIKYLVEYFKGNVQAVAEDGYFGNFISDSWQVELWFLVFAALVFIIILGGVQNGVERMSKIMMPVLFGLFLVLAVYIATLPGAQEGYKYILKINPAGLADPKVWVFAFGQAFFSLSVAGNGSVIYGSYLPKDEDLPSSARNVALFDTIAALLAAIVIIPAMAVILGDGIVGMKGGPGLMFVYLVNVFNAMPGGRIVGMIFYICVLFAGVSSIVNLYEAPVAFLQEKLHTNRVLSVVIIGAVGGVIALCIQPWTSQWMDVVSIYICPLGALLAGIMFFWVMKKDTALAAVHEGRTAGKKDISGWFYPLGKWVYCAASLAALILGAIYGGIG